MVRQRCGWASRRCLVISHAKRLQINERENHRRAPEDSLLVECAGDGGYQRAQTMRVWPGLRLGAPASKCKGVFITVSGVEERVSPESGQNFEPRELLKHTRLCSAITRFRAGPDPPRPGLALRRGLSPFHHEAPLTWADQRVHHALRGAAAMDVVAFTVAERARPQQLPHHQDRPHEPRICDRILPRTCLLLALAC